MTTLPFLVLIVAPIIFADNNDPHDPQVIEAATKAITQKGQSPAGLRIMSSHSQASPVGTTYDIVFFYTQGGGAIQHMVVMQPVDKNAPVQIITFG
ncbi:hypothetical protein L596_028571 [Steinernema carpocapsae]|uniref:Cystatin domain-containing protein n=1 Tax=Steinernema carpocapsae TaxID=34508 RepID=A0A4U5LYW0_STECR|nr:hypothetical protein L596_028571 [Steinernema carpocapsae]